MLFFNTKLMYLNKVHNYHFFIVFFSINICNTADI